MKVISVINNKGGVGKTTTTLHLASKFAEEGANILIVDLDPQTNLSQGFIPKDIYLEKRYTIENFLSREKGFYAYHRDKQPLLKIIQGSKTFNPKYYQVDDLVKSLTLLNNLSEDKFDYVFIDCPPAIYFEEENKLQIPELAIYTADFVLVPIKADYYSFEGLVSLLNSIQSIGKKHHKEINIAGIFINQAKTNQVNFNMFADIYKNHDILKKYFLNTFVRENSAIDRACNENLTIFEYDPKSIGAEDFTKLFNEVKQKINI